MAFWTIVQIVVTIATAALSISNASKAKKRARRARRNAAIRQVQIRETNAGLPVVIPWGRTAVNAVPVKATFAADFAVPSTDLISGQTLGDLTLPKENSKRLQALCYQSVLCQGPIESVGDVWINDKSISDPRYRRNFRIEWQNGNLVTDVDGDGNLLAGKTSRASIAAMAFSSQNLVPIPGSSPANPARDGTFKTTDRFTGLVFSTTFYFHDLTDPILSEGPLPEELHFVQGAKARRITKTGQAYALAPESQTSNWGRVVLETLMGRLGVPSAEVDLPSLYDAQNKSNVVVLGPNEQVSSVTSRQPVRQSTYAPFGIPIADYAQYLRDAGYDAEGNLLTTNGGFSPSGIAIKTDLMRYEANGNMWTSETPQDNLEMLMECVPGAHLFRSRAGRYKVAMPSEEGDALSQVQDVIDGSILVGSVRVSYPDADSKANRMEMRFPNIFKDLAHDTVQVPAPRSYAETTMLAQDNGVVLTASDELELTNNGYHAYSIGATRILLTRRRVYAFRTTEEGVFYEPGDVVRLVSPDDGIDAVVRLEGLGQLIEEEDDVPMFDFIAVEHRPEDFKFHNRDIDSFEFAAPPERDLKIPKSVSAVFDADAKEFTVSFEPHDDAGVDEAFYVLERKDGTKPFRHLATIGATEDYSFPHIAPFSQGNIQYRVASKALDGGQSGWRTGSVLAFDNRLTSTAGSVSHFVPVPPGRCPPLTLGKEGDTNFPPGSNILWRRSKTLFDAAENTDGVLAKLSNLQFNWDAATNQWVANPNHLLPAESQTRPPAYLTEIRLGDRGHANQITIGQLTGVAPTFDTATFPDTPLATAGNVGEAATGPDGQRWARGAGVGADLVGPSTGIVARGVMSMGTHRSGNVFQTWRVFLSGTDNATRIGVDDAYSTEPSAHLFHVDFKPNGEIYIDFDKGTEPPYERVDLIDRLERGDLVVAARAGTSGTWAWAVKPSTGTTDPYRWTPTEAQWLTFAAAEFADPGRVVRGKQIQIALLDRTKRAALDPANNPWYRQTADDAAKNFISDLDGNLILAMHWGRGSSFVLQTEVGADVTNPYGWTPTFAVNEAIALNKTDTNEAHNVFEGVWLVDGSKRCRADVTSPWLPQDRAAGSDGLGAEDIWALTATDAPPVAPDNNWAFDRPALPWQDGFPSNFGQANPFVWFSRRAVTGTPAGGTPKSDAWGDWDAPRKVAAFAQDGRPGVAGLPGMSKIIFYDQRVDVMTNVDADTPNPTNPNEAGEYAILEREASGDRPTTTRDITSWQDLYDRAGDNENLTLRLSRWDVDGFDYRKYLLDIEGGGIITMMAVDAAGNLDTSQWIDFRVVRRGATRDFVDDEGTFVGVHIDAIEHVSPDMPAYPLTTEKQKWAFGFSWAGSKPDSPTTEIERYYQLAVDEPADPVKANLTFGDGNPPVGWLIWRENARPSATLTESVWLASRTRTAGTVGSWTVSEAVPRLRRQYQNVYRRHTNPSTPSNSIAWGVTPGGWSASPPSPTTQFAVYRARRWRVGTRTPTRWTVTLYRPTIAPPPPPAALGLRVVWGTWQDVPGSPGKTRMTFQSIASGGRRPYTYTPYGDRSTGRGTFTVNKSAAGVTRRLTFRFSAWDSSSPRRQASVRSTSPVVPTA